ncbi:uncharacterized protein LOC144141076 isoform X2 [Haemaphysalis longicornis]
MRSKLSNGQAKRGAAASIPPADLENAKGAFTGAAIDYRLPCTASKNTTCQIVWQLPTWNEFLCKAHLELREMPGTRSQLSLSECLGTATFEATEEELHQTATLVYWLLRTHHCVVAVHMPGTLSDPVNSPLLSSALRDNSSVKCLTFGELYFQFPKNLCKVIPTLAQLETFEFVGLICWPQAARLKATLALLLETTESLTCLRIPEVDWRDGRGVRKFLAALEANYTLEELSVHTSLIEDVPRALKEKFRDFVKNNLTLTTLTVHSSHIQDKNTLYWFLSCIEGNKTLSKVNFVGFQTGRLGANILPVVLKENRSLLSFNLIEANLRCSMDRNRYDSWFDVFAHTETLEELTLPVDIWAKEQWQLFFNALAQNRNLNDVTIEVNEFSSMDTSGLSAALKVSGAASKVLIKHPHMYGPLYSPITFTSKGLSELCIGPGEESFRERLSRIVCQLPSYTNITSIDLEIDGFRWRNTQFSAFSQYIESTTTLRKLRVTSWARDPMTMKFWMIFVCSLGKNVSVRELSAEMCRDEEVAKALADVIKASQNICRVHLGSDSRSMLAAFIQRLSLTITDNYTLTRVTVEDIQRILEEAWFAIRSVAARNSSLVTRAAQYVSGAACDRYRAQALERVSLSPSLMEEVAEVTFISSSEIVSRVREGLKCFEELHDFMRLCGVVEETVTCHPRKDGRTQLDQLNADCWRHIRRYLLVEDIKMPTQSANTGFCSSVQCSR